MSGGAIAEADKRSLALAAAHSAAEAAADLMRYAREGEWFKGSPFHPDIEPLEKLCDAAKMVAEIGANSPTPRETETSFTGHWSNFWRAGPDG